MLSFDVVVLQRDFRSRVLIKFLSDFLRVKESSTSCCSLVVLGGEKIDISFCVEVSLESMRNRR